MREPERKYTITRQLGRGGMGQVWAALKHGDGGMQMPCAIKVLWPALAMTEEDRERFYGEARIAAQLDHGRIVKVIDTTVVQGSPSLVMEWVDGVNLRALLEHAREDDTPRIGVNVALYIVGEILTALAYAHSRTVAGENAAVIHSDVTPGNILISSSGEVKLTDFGIARFVRMSDQTMSRAMGTPRYMAPEQMRGRIYTATDIYSLGVVLHELVEGERYFHECATEEFQYRVLSGQIPDLTQPNVPAWVDALRRRMLSLDPEQRPAAEDAYSMIVERSDNYALAALELKRLYQRVVGGAKSGFTEIIELRHGGDPAKFFEELWQQQQQAKSSRAATSPGIAAGTTTGTRGDTIPPSLPAANPAADGPAVLRRAGASPAAGTGIRTAEHTSTGGAIWTGEDDQSVGDATALLPLVFAEQAAAADAVTVNEGPGAHSSAAAAAVTVADELHTSSRSVHGREDVTSEAVLVGHEPREGAWIRYAALAAGAAAFLSAGVFIASLMRVADERPDEAVVQTQASDAAEVAAPPVEPEQPPAATPEPTPVAEPVEVAEPEPESAETGEPTEVEVEAEAEAEAEPEPPVAEPAPEPKPKPKPEPKPRAKSKPTVPVNFLVLAKSTDGSKAVEIKVGNKQWTSDNGFKKVSLEPGSYKVQWRWPGGAWNQVGSITIESGLPSGSYYAAKLDVGKLVVSKTLGSSK